MADINRSNNRRNKKEITDAMYDNVGRTESLEVNRERHQPLQSGSECVKSRSSRVATLCLGLLCAVLLTAVIVLCVQITERNYIKNYTEERDQILTKIISLTEERDQKIKTLTNEKNELISENDNLIKQRDQLIKEKNNLLIFLNDTDGWIYYQHSCYYLSSGWMSWNESRRDCLQRGADLMIINNREEQDFLRRRILFRLDRVWIGLSDRAEEGTWKWADGTTLTSEFWRPGEPNSYTGEEDCAASDSTGWYDWRCQEPYVWICEKSILK